MFTSSPAADQSVLSARLSESMIASADFDQPEHTGTRIKIFICASPRTGSNMLCRMMIEAGLGIPMEYFNPAFLPGIAGRLGVGGAARALTQTRRPGLGITLFRRDPVLPFIANYSKALLRRRTRDGIFAVKLQYWEWVRFLDNAVGEDLLQGGIFVHLHREDLLSQAVSARVAELTGVWDQDGATTTKPSAAPDFFDRDEIRRTARMLSAEDRNWRLFFLDRGLTPITTSYEAICRDPAAILAQIADAAGRTVRPAAVTAARYNPYVQPGVPSKSEIIRHYLRGLRPAGGPARPAPARKPLPATAAVQRA